MTDKVLQIRVCTVRLESQSVLKGNRERDNKVHSANLLEDSLARVLVRDVLGMNPKDTTECLRSHGKHAPVSTAFSITLVCSGGSERQTQTDNETQDGKQNRVNRNLMNSHVDDCNGG
jgi:hypothetical protein